MPVLTVRHDRALPLTGKHAAVSNPKSSMMKQNQKTERGSQTWPGIEEGGYDIFLHVTHAFYIPN